ncbi:hypothetical protein K7X08_031000 [Anisodus acutangulus]|uniref:Uncharacterized protein n=1 Tax=Anisodus acutangulus TaxID=402998 RepID=A0A9Q1MUV3_9SOLA|nr:hypothetical protein K7X08_031000 [Anisodus acutangulus]
MEAEVEDLKKPNYEVREQLAAVEKRQSDVTRDYDSLMTELEPLHAELQSRKDTNLEERKARIEESEQVILIAWEDTKKVAAVLPIVLSFSVVEVVGVAIFFASLTVIDIIQSAKVPSPLVVLTADPFFPRKDFALVKGQGSSSPYVVSELTLVATVSFHHPPLLDEQEIEAVLCQLWTINLVPESSTDPRSTHDKARVRQLSEMGLSPQWIMDMGRGKLSVNKKKSSLYLKKFFKK